MRILFPGLLASALVLAAPLAQADTGPGTISVTGTATVAAIPDLARLSIGVTSQAETAAKALAANSEALTAVIGRLVAAGIADRDMQTSNLTLAPNWDAASGVQRTDSFVASNQLSLRIRDIAKLGAVLDAAVQDGANRLDMLSFELEDDAAEQEAARKAAVADAMSRAKALTEAAGVTLGPILSITEGGFGQPGPAPMFRMEASAVPVAAGEVGISAQVTITWALE